MTGTRRGFLWANLVLAILVIVGVVLQVYLVAAGTTGEPDALDWHRDLGGFVHLVEVLAWVAAIVAFWRNWREIGLQFLLPLIGTVQLAFAPEEGKAPSDGWVHGFHGLLALAVFVLAGLVAHRAMRLLGLGRSAAAP